METEVSKEELQGAKLALINYLPVSLENNRAVAKMLLSIHYYGLGDDYLEKFSEFYLNLKPEDLKKAARNYLSDELVEVLAGPVKKDKE